MHLRDLRKLVAEEEDVRKKKVHHGGFDSNRDEELMAGVVEWVWCPFFCFIRADGHGVCHRLAIYDGAIDANGISKLDM